MNSQIFWHFWLIWYYIRMLIYFDECYDGGHKYLILAALFNPKPQKLHKAFLEAKRSRNFVKPNGQVKEIGYNDCYNKQMYRLAKKAIDCFMDSSSYFRAIVIGQSPESGYDLDHFGRPDEPRKMKEARAYKKFAELLISSNCKSIKNGVLFFDRLTRCNGDEFLQLMRDKFCQSGEGGAPIFKHIQEVDTALEQYHIGQIGDILQGSILNELVPPTNKWKCKVRKYLRERIGVNTLSSEYWDSMPKWEQEQKHPKYQIWYWKPIKK